MLVPRKRLLYLQRRYPLLGTHGRRRRRVNPEFNRYGFTVNKDIVHDDIIVPIQQRKFADRIPFDVACKPPLWLTTFLTWHPHPMENLWRTQRGSEWVPQEPVEIMRVGTVEVIRETRFAMRLILSAGKLQDISELLHHAGALRISIPEYTTQTSGNVALKYKDLQHIEDSLNDFTDCI